MVNTGQTVVATVQTPGGMPTYAGDARIDGVPGTAAPIADRPSSDAAGSIVRRRCCRPAVRSTRSTALPSP